MLVFIGDLRLSFLYVCIFMHTCMYTCFVYMYKCMYLYVHIYVCMCKCVYMHIYVYIYVCIFMYACMRVCIYLYVYRCIFRVRFSFQVFDLICTSFASLGLFSQHIYFIKVEGCKMYIFMLKKSTISFHFIFHFWMTKLIQN